MLTTGAQKPQRNKPQIIITKVINVAELKRHSFSSLNSLKQKSHLLQVIDFHSKIHNWDKTELLMAIFNSAVTKKPPYKRYARPLSSLLRTGTFIQRTSRSIASPESLMPKCSTSCNKAIAMNSNNGEQPKASITH